MGIAAEFSTWPRNIAQTSALGNAGMCYRARLTFNFDC